MSFRRTGIDVCRFCQRMYCFIVAILIVTSDTEIVEHLKSVRHLFVHPRENARGALVLFVLSEFSAEGKEDSGIGCRHSLNQFGRRVGLTAAVGTIGDINESESQLRILRGAGP